MLSSSSSQLVTAFLCHHIYTERYFLLPLHMYCRIDIYLRIMYYIVYSIYSKKSKAFLCPAITIMHRDLIPSSIAVVVVFLGAKKFRLPVRYALFPLNSNVFRLWCKESERDRELFCLSKFMYPPRSYFLNGSKRSPAVMTSPEHCWHLLTTALRIDHSFRGSRLAHAQIR